MAKDVEVELKYRLKNIQTVIEFLTKNAKFKHDKNQHDVYYNHPHRNFLEDINNVCEWLRIRVYGNKAEITYKDYLPRDSKIKTHCTEFETTVASYDQLTKILGALNFKKLIDVIKYRRSWDFKDTEISIDIVKDLGEFIEIEYTGKLDNIEAIRKYLFEIMKMIPAEVGDLDTKGYPYLLLEINGFQG